MEKSNNVPSAPAESLEKVRALLEAEGIEFSQTDDGWVGVRINIRSKTDAV